MSYSFSPTTESILVRDTLLQLFLVEDSALLRDLLIDSFSLIAGLKVAGWADSEEDALKQLQQFPCDIIVVDIQLRQGNGIALLSKLAALHSNPDRVSIVISNNVSTAYRQLSTQLPNCFFFDKTTQFEELQEFLSTLGLNFNRPAQQH